MTQVIGGDTSTFKRSLWFRMAWHALLELFLFAALAELICQAAQPLELSFLRASVVVGVLKVGYKVASVVANKRLIEGDDEDD